MGLPSNQKGGEIAARVVFYSEIALNIISLALMARPKHFLATFIPKATEDLGLVDKYFGPGGQAFLFWWGTLLVVLSYGEARALISFNNTALAVIMEALLLGDLLHAAAAWYLARAVGGWTAGNLTGLVLAFFLAGWRIYWLAVQYKYNLKGGGVSGKNE